MRANAEIESNGPQPSGAMSHSGSTFRMKAHWLRYQSLTSKLSDSARSWSSP